MSKPNLLLIEDDETLGTSLVQRLTLEGFSTRWARSAAQAQAELARSRPDVIVSDIRLPDGDGESVMRAHFEQVGLVPTIFMTAYGEIDQAVRLVRDGAWDYVSKPFDLDALIERLRPISSIGRISESSPGNRLGGSPAMRAASELLAKAADVDLPVTLMGETGTGKEVAARFIHQAGHRSDRPFVAVNAGLLHSEMADSLMFGHERGAFTGANASHVGFAEEAGDGTLFLDEIGELSLAMQVKLLRLIEQRSFRRLGGTHDLAFRGRIVCATNRDLEVMVEEGNFRRDLWYRINVITCILPPLRERCEDIAELLSSRLETAAQRFGRHAPRLTADAIAAAVAHRWPGNVRELVNRIDRAVALGDAEAIGPADLFPERQSENAVAPATLLEAREMAERHHIIAVLQQNEGRIQPAARQLGISRTTLWEKMNRYGIDGDQA